MSTSKPNSLRLPLKALARLLSYPDAELKENIEVVAETLGTRPELASGEQMSVDRLVGWMRSEVLLELQAAYVETFDRGKRVSLHLFEHVYGESRDRGPAMVELSEAYRKHGLEIDCRELPDYLPLLLEFCAELNEAETRSWLEEIGRVLQQIHVRLVQRESRYAVPFRVLLRLAGLEPEPHGLVLAAADEERDDTPAALDRIWMEAPVTFGPAQPVTGCGATAPRQALPVQWMEHPGAAGRPGRT